jgi:hypothetical protein
MEALYNPDTLQALVNANQVPAANSGCQLGRSKGG